jgi:hypothetical protein
MIFTTNDMESKQTAIEWLRYKMLIECIEASDMLFEQAKEMEKQQIIEAYEYTAAGTSHYGEMYYNETFKSE